MAAQRLECVYDDSLSDRFRLVGIPYTNQYYRLCNAKLESLRPALEQSVKLQWSDVVDSWREDAEKLATQGFYTLVQSIKYAMRGNCVIIGSLYKEMRLRPHALQEYMHDADVEQPSLTNYTADDDYLAIEDSTLRLTLTGDALDPHKMVTGLIVAVKGHLDDCGHFFAEDYLLPGPPIPLDFKSFANEDKYLAIVSGLEVADGNKWVRELILLRDFLLGNNAYNQKIVRLVIAGNGIGQCDVNTLQEADTYMAVLSASLHVDLMPGPDDPSNLNLPQQPVHPCLMEHSKRYTTFRSTTNPYFFSLDGIRFLGTSGQVVKGICDFSKLSEIDALRMSVNARCIAPTAPDSLGCHPDATMFNLVDDAEFPHLFFSGNCNQFAVDSGMPKLICVPKFSKEALVVLVSLQTLDVSTIKLT